MKTCYYGNPNAQKILIQLADPRDLPLMEQEFGHIRRLTAKMQAETLQAADTQADVRAAELQAEADFLLAAVLVDHWNLDLSPWPAPAVFGKEAFGDGAEETLRYLTEELIPALAEGNGRERERGVAAAPALSKEPKTFYIGGYSLAGLFALWSVYQTGLFQGVAAVSPSVWFPGFTGYCRENPLQTGSVYLSLGDREEKTRNKVMARVGTAIREIHGHLKEQSVPSVLEWNPGNHFQDPDLRIARGFAWLLSTNSSGNNL